jgi:hypothetical protein
LKNFLDLTTIEFIFNSRGKTLYLDTELFNKASDEIGLLSVKRLTGTVVSSDPERAAMSVLYYKNLSKLVFSLPELEDKTSKFITIIGKLLLSNIPNATVYLWGSDYTAEHSISYPASTEIETFLSELAYLVQAYKDIDYSQTIITSFGAITRYVFGRIYQQLEGDNSPKTMTLDPTFYRDLEKYANVQSTSSSIRGIAWITSVIYFILKQGKGRFVDYLNFLRKEKSVNITRINKPITTIRSLRLHLLHEWNVVCSGTEMIDLLGKDWSQLMKRQRKTLSDYRRGRDITDDLKQIEEEVKTHSTDAERVVVYARQRKLHAWMKERREHLSRQKSEGTSQTITPTRTDWRQHCVNTGDKLSLCEVTIPLIKKGFISSEEQIKNLIFKATIESSIQSLIWEQEELSADPIYMTLLATSNDEDTARSIRDNALYVLSIFESRTATTRRRF